MSRIELIATSPMGLEAVVAREVRELGYEEVTVENGRVSFIGNELAICRANLWLRTADRILIKMGEFEARTFEELFEGTKALPWPSWIPENGEFPVEGRSQKSQLSSVPACQGIVKKAIVEKMKQQYRTEWFPETGARYVIEVSLLKDVATLTLDTTGAGLHKRGYRKLVTEAPLKETMAAAMVLLSRWRAERPLYDPFCGSGTIPIEAAMIGWNIAPGLRRSFTSEAWEAVPAKLWDRAREEAYDALCDDVPLDIVGSDLDPKAIEVAEAAAKAAGLAKELRFRAEPVARAKPRGDYGCLITNPPYGERLGDQKEVERALRSLGLLVAQLPTWSTFVLSPSKQMEHYLGRKADKKRKLYNGRIECQLTQLFGPLPPRPKSAPKP
ncbi:class I SAM-dependent RNA methyltransferase [Paenibacillus larvae]|uniref:Class I SAM-dependent RNA methyltransferase n=2 Tax=Paenibacillus larvae TaxID=1464 RepID=A0AAP5JUT4_9BACL|nr:class I SAM-dependent RNA methyltransferase [Paenibacillus larvae]AQR78010.1 RNA methyltransferase [Paenibacillus larvae subsp. larvae]AVF20828.1 putative RNA methyltransferase YpsC [Paenibacillus larvae subsp. larvae]ETK28203.1 putative RNA methyltransferase YpsC [Paenibacillus larvae subsp. larvae DSM 25719]MCY7490026.1 class I SAM-dependent RNA methyltransferase [Paenibacillus larvae]MCY9564238.1 class I SAM-dependent RNA methyltransferase [Paenibacillus larvae]